MIRIGIGGTRSLKSQERWNFSLIEACKLQIDNGIEVLLKSCEYLDLTPKEGIKNILYKVDKEGFPHLKHLYVRNSIEIQYIVNLMEFKCVAFPVLQSLSLYNIENLEEICHDQVPMGSFGSLKKFQVSKCEKLTSVFSLTMFGCFSQLQEIKIEDCEVMCAIFSKERKHEIQVNHDIRTDIIDFTQLRSLYLRNLPNLVGFHPDADSQLLFNEKVLLWLISSPILITFPHAHLLVEHETRIWLLF